MSNIVATGIKFAAKSLDKQAKAFYKYRANLTSQNILNYYKQCDKPLSEWALETRDKFTGTMKACNVAPEILKELQNAKTVGELRSAIFNFQNVYKK